MKKILNTIKHLLKKKIISKYAIGGSVAVIAYTEPFETKDLDIFIPLIISSSGLIDLSSIFNELKKLGFKMKDQFWIIDGIPVEFLPTYDDVTEEALDMAIKKKLYHTDVNVFRPEHIIAIALKTGRSKDYAKIDLLIEQTKINMPGLFDVLSKFNLLIEWNKYNEK
jgi:hypothetical protein